MTALATLDDLKSNGIEVTDEQTSLTTSAGIGFQPPVKVTVTTDGMRPKGLHGSSR